MYLEVAEGALYECRSEVFLTKPRPLSLVMELERLKAGLEEGVVAAASFASLTILVLEEWFLVLKRLNKFENRFFFSSGFLEGVIVTSGSRS